MGPPADINILGISLHLYSVFMAAGIFVGFSLARRSAAKFGVNLEHFDTTILFALLFGFLGARLFFVAGHWSNFYQNNWLEILQFWRGGLAFYGALIAGVATILAAKFYYKFNLLKFLDAVALGLPLAQAIGRLGNYFNQEAYGLPTNLPWGIYISPEKRLAGYENFSTFHPTFLYEAIGLVIIFAILWHLKKLQPSVGLLFAFYAMMSGSLRAVIETLRPDALMVHELKISQLTAIVLVMGGLWLVFYIRKNSVRQAT